MDRQGIIMTLGTAFNAPLDFFAWGFIKSKVNLTLLISLIMLMIPQVNDLEGLKNLIRKVANTGYVAESFSVYLKSLAAIP